MKSRLLRLLQISTLLFLLPLTCFADDSPAASITVDASKILGPVNRMDFGQSIESGDGRVMGNVRKPWMSDFLVSAAGLWDAKQKQVFPAVADDIRGLGMGALRFPGGCLVHSWDWRQSVGPIADRGKGNDFVLPGEWAFGLDEYLQVCKQFNAEPIITTSDYILPADQMPQLQAGLVEYLNAPATPDHPWAMKRAAYGHPAPYGVKYFELGNESWHGNHGIRPHRQFSPETYADFAVSCAQAMRAVDPTIKLGIVVWNENDTDWNKTVLQQAGRIADFVVMHIYLPTFSDTMPPPASDENLTRGCMEAGQQTQFKLDQIHQQIRDNVGHDLPMAITEYNSGMERTKPPFWLSYGAALDAADMLRVFLEPRNNVEIANYWDLLSSHCGMISNWSAETGHKDHVPVPEQRPAYPMFRLWGTHFGAQLVDVQTQGPVGTYISDNPIMYSAQGSQLQPAALVTTVPLTEDVDFSKLPADMSGEKSPDGAIFTLNNYKGYAIVNLGNFSLPLSDPNKRMFYRLSYEGRLNLGEGGKPAALNLVLSDAGGKEAPMNSAQFLGPMMPDWHSFSRYYTVSVPGQRAIYGRFHSEMPVSGQLEIRNLQLECYTEPVLPAYPLVTSSASLSADGKTLYLIVFNKGESGSIHTKIATAGFAPAAAKLWQVTCPKPDLMTTVSGVQETTSGEAVPVTDNHVALDLPAHSMSALEITAR